MAATHTAMHDESSRLHMTAEVGLPLEECP